MNNTPHHPKPPVVALAQNIGGNRVATTQSSNEGLNERRTNGARPRHGSIVLFDAAPYPEISGHGDPATIAMLKDDYAGRTSELTAITQYIFQNNSSDDETFANAMLQIAIVEMTHLDMLGDAIHKLGGTTEFKSGGEFWTAANVDYSRDRADMLRANIVAEQGAIESYERHASATHNSSVRALLLRIADDERLHLKFFQDQLAAELRRQGAVVG